MRRTPLTDIDRRMLAHLQDLYGPPQRAPAVARPARAGRARRHTVGLLIRTSVLVGAAVLLVAGTEPGKTMSGWLSDQLAAVDANVVELLR